MKRVQIKEGTNHLHAEIFNTIVKGFEKYLYIHRVVPSSPDTPSRWQISQIKFAKGGLQSFLEDVKTIDSMKLVPEAFATSAVAQLGAELCKRIDGFNQTREKKIHFGLRLRSNNQLGVYLTVGVQDLESFFQRGKELNRMRLEAIVNGGGEPG